jgi:hypothetical protein
VTRPIGGGTIDPLDRRAHDELLKSSEARVKTMRTRAEKWIGGLTALTGLLAIVYVLKGPESISGFSIGWKLALAGLSALSLVALAGATYKAYSSAFGDVVNAEGISPHPVDGLHRRLFQARLTAETKAKEQLSDAVSFAFVGLFLAAAAITLSWFAPAGGEDDKAVCIVDAGGSQVARFPGSTIEVESLGEGVTIRSCG